MSRRFVTPRVLRQVREFIAQGRLTAEIVRATGLSESTIFKIRQGRYDEHRLRQRFPDDTPASEDGADPAGINKQSAGKKRKSNKRAGSQDNARKVTWCPECRCHIFPPCQLCRARRHRRTVQRAKAKRRSALIPDDVDELTRARQQLSVAQIGLPMRMTNFLQRSGIETVNDLLHCTRAELMRIPNVARKSVDQIFRALERLGFRGDG